jgi:hypothetical protein
MLLRGYDVDREVIVAFLRERLHAEERSDA